MPSRSWAWRRAQAAGNMRSSRHRRYLVGVSGHAVSGHGSCSALDDSLRSLRLASAASAGGTPPKPEYEPFADQVREAVAETLADNARYQEQARRLLEGQGEGDVTPASPTISQRGPGPFFPIPRRSGAAMGPGVMPPWAPRSSRGAFPGHERHRPRGAWPGGGAVWLLLLPVLSVDQPTASVAPLFSSIGAVPAHRN